MSFVCDVTVKNLVEDADDGIFSRVLYSENHVLRRLLPDRNEHAYELWHRHRRRQRILTSNDDKRNFVHSQLHMQNTAINCLPHHTLSLLFNSVLTFHMKKMQQESRAVARKPRDTACYQSEMCVSWGRVCRPFYSLDKCGGSIISLMQFFQYEQHTFVISSTTS